MNTKNFSLILGALIIGLFFGFLIGQQKAIDETLLTPSVTEGRASVMLDYGDGEVKTYNNFQAGSSTLFEITKTITSDERIGFESKEYPGLGVLIEKIGDKKNGDQGSYWQYWVNNQSLQVGADAYVVRSGDIVSWKFMPYVEE